MPFFFIFLLALLAYFLLTRLASKRKYSDFPGPSPFLSLPIIGHGYLLGSDPLAKLIEFRRRYGDVFRLDIGNQPTIFLGTNNLMAEAFRKEAFSGRKFNEIDTLNAVLPVGHLGLHTLHLHISFY